MDRKVTVIVSTKLVFNLEEGIEVCDALNEMDYKFSSEVAEMVDSEILDYQILDSK